MPEFIKHRIQGSNLDRQTEQELATLLNALLDGVRAIAVKLDADATVTDTNYTAVFDNVIAK